MTAEGPGPAAGASGRTALQGVPPLLAIDQLGVRYPGQREPALQEISLDLPAGAFVGVAGRTGAGKSTLALAAAGFIPRVVHARLEGSVRVDSVTTATAGASDLAGRVGIVFSTPANQLSASKLTVREELAFGLENLGVPRETMDERIDEVLDHLGIAHLAEREPFALSGGEQQRVAIASIVVMGTGVVVLDEPTAQLDPGGTRAVGELLCRLAADGRAVLCAEHTPTILGLAGRCLVLEAGREVALDQPARALGSAVLGSLGLRPPTILRLAELAAVPAEDAFDEEAVAAALARWAGRDLDRPGGTPGAGPEGSADSGGREAAVGTGPRPASPAAALPPWRPVRHQPPVAVEVRGLVHRYPNGIEAVRGIDLTVPAGEAIAIVGQNGSGKTTLAKHLNGLLRPASGRVTIGGRDIAGDPVSVIARTVGFVFQNPDDQLFNRSVEREVMFGPRNLGLDGRTIAALVDQALALTGLAEVRAVNPYDLGLSTRKLVALASVLAMDPAVIILDEPTTGQDGPGVELVGAIVEALRQAGRTVIAISHDMEFVAERFPRVVVMREGRIVDDGPPGLVFAPERAGLLASTGLVPPPAARIGARLGLGATPTEQALLAALRRR